MCSTVVSLGRLVLPTHSRVAHMFTSLSLASNHRQLLGICSSSSGSIAAEPTPLCCEFLPRPQSRIELTKK